MRGIQRRYRLGPRLSVAVEFIHDFRRVPASIRYEALTADSFRRVISRATPIHDRIAFRELVDQTDRDRHEEAEYRKQLSVYYHVARAVYPDREITASILYTETGTRRYVDPFSREQPQDLVADVGAPSVPDPNSTRV
jgi:hypothetical protein